MNRTMRSIRKVLSSPVLVLGLANCVGQEAQRIRHVWPFQREPIAAGHGWP